MVGVVLSISAVNCDFLYWPLLQKGSVFEGRELHLPVGRKVSVWDAVRYCAGLINCQS